MNIMKLKRSSIHILVFLFLFSPILLLGGESEGPDPGLDPGEGEGPNPVVTTIKIQNPVRGASTLYEFISLVINNIVLPLGGVIAVLYIMYAGFLLVTARGDEKQIGEGKAAFTNAAIGTAILLGAWVIAQVIETTINQLRA